MTATPATIPPEVLEGIALFNAGEYFEAHEAWEAHWGKGGPRERAATLGLIKAAVALEHLKNGNARGFAWQAERALQLLREHVDVWPQLEFERLADELESVGAQHRHHGHVDASEYPKLPSF